jgi:hypothetical protein
MDNIFPLQHVAPVVKTVIHPPAIVKDFYGVIVIIGTFDDFTQPMKPPCTIAHNKDMNKHGGSMPICR